MLTSICMALVGLVFVLTGLIKAVNTRPLIRQLEDYRAIPIRWTALLGLSFVAFEWLFGVALLVRLTDWLLPFGIAALVLLTALTVWGTATGRVEECGCYGGLLQLTPRQSVALNLTYIAVLAVGWAGLGRGLSTTAVVPWKVAAAVLAGAAGYALGRVSFRRGALVEYSLLKPGKRWNPRWLRGDVAPVGDASSFVVFLSQDCPYCKKWVPLLNVLHVQPDLPGVIGLLSGDGATRERFLADHLIRFPLTHVSRGLAGLMVKGYPTAVLIERGVIRRTWFGEMPQEYVDRIRDFYQAISVGKAKSPVGFSG